MKGQGRDYDACLLLDVAGHTFGFDLGAVKAVMPYHEPTPVPFQDRAVFGGLLYRGVFMGVAGFGRLVGMDCRTDTEKAVIAVIETGGCLLGLVADSSRGVVRNMSGLEEVRVLGKVEGPLVKMAVKAGTVTVNVVDTDALTDAFADILESAR